MSKQRVFTVTASDCREDTFRCGGKGGQNVNKRDTGVRFTHEPSGAVGESREERSQLANRRRAFERLAKHPKFQAWARVQAAAVLEGHASIERKIDRLMSDDNLRVETAAECVPCEAFCDAKEPRP